MRHGLYTAAALLALAVDALLPLGVAGDVPLILVVLLTVREGNVRETLWVAAGCTAVALVGMALRSLGAAPTWLVVSNHLLAILGIWAAALTVVWSHAASEARVAARAEDQRIREERLREQTALTRLGSMAAVVAHEVRNPLTGIAGSLEIVQKRMPEGQQERQVIASILERIETLHETMDDLLLYARPHLPSFERVELAALVTGVQEEAERDPRFGSVALRTHAENHVLVGDPALLGAAVLNLVLNAAQAMSGAGEVRLRAYRSGEEVRVVVADTGPGIPTDLRQRIFEPFFTTRHLGSGLGLSIVRRIVDAHGGSVELECPEGGGSVFTLRLPLSSTDAPAEGMSPAESAAEALEPPALPRRLDPTHGEAPNLLVLADLRVLAELTVGHLAHEIRNPLAGLQASLERLQGGDRDSSVSERYFGLMKDALRRVESSIAAAVESVAPSHEEPSVVDIARTVSDCCRILGPELVRAGVELKSPEIPAEAAAWAGRRRLRHALLCLGRNAIWASTPGGVVRVNATMGLRRVGLHVRHDGPLRAGDATGQPPATPHPRAAELGTLLAVAERVLRVDRGEVETAVSALGETRVSLWLRRKES